MLNDLNADNSPDANATQDGQPTDVNAAAPASDVTAEPQSDATPAAPAQVSDDSGTAMRLKQELAKKDKALRNLGIDPDSSAVDQLELGVATADDFLRKPQTESQQTTLAEKLNQLKENITSDKPVTENRYKQDMAAALDVVGEIVQQTDNQNRQREMEIMIDRNIAASKAQFGQSETVANLPPEIREVAEDLMLGLTDIEVGRFSRTLPPDRVSAAMQPQVYQKMAGAATKRFEAIYAHAFKAGQNAALGNIQTNPSGVNPLPSGGPAAPPPGPDIKKQMNIRNLDDNVNAYLQRSRLQV